MRILAPYTVITANLPGLAKSLAKRLGAIYSEAQTHEFADGECRITIKAKPHGPLIIVNSTHPPVDSNIVRTLLLISRARQLTDDVTAVIPYMGYARQDKEFMPGEIIAADAVALLFRKAGARRIITVDIHSIYSMKKSKARIKNVSAVPCLADYFKRIKLDSPLAVSPDAGGAARAREFAYSYGCDHLILKKSRDKRTGKLSMSGGDKKAKDRDVIIIDDMISTGGSIIKAASLLKKYGCGKIYVACTHALLIGDARTKMRKAGIKRIISANTIPGKEGIVDVSNVIAQAITGKSG